MDGVTEARGRGGQRTFLVLATGVFVLAIVLLGTSFHTLWQRKSRERSLLETCQGEGSWEDKLRAAIELGKLGSDHGPRCLLVESNDAASLALDEIRERRPAWTVSRVAALLEDPDASLRRKAASTILKWSPGCHEQMLFVEPQLVEAVQHPDHGVAALASIALLRNGIRPPRLLARLEDVLESPEAEWRPRAAEALYYFGDQGRPALKSLCAWLTLSPEASAEASRALVRLGGEAVEPLVKLCEHPVTNVRRAALRTLGGLGSRAIYALPRLVESLDDPSADVRAQAAEAIGRIGPAAAHEASALQERLFDSSRVRSSALLALARLNVRESAVLSAARELLNDTDADARAIDAACAAASLFVEEAPDLVEQLKSVVAERESQNAYTGWPFAALARADSRTSRLAVLNIARAWSSRPELTCDLLVWLGRRAACAGSTLVGHAGDVVLQEKDDLTALGKLEDLARAFACIAPAGAEVVPFASFLEHNRERVRFLSLCFLAELGPLARLVESHVAALLKDPSSRIRRLATAILDRLRAEGGS